MTQQPHPKVSKPTLSERVRLVRNARGEAAHNLDVFTRAVVQYGDRYPAAVVARDAWQARADALTVTGWTALAPLVLPGHSEAPRESNA